LIDFYRVSALEVGAKLPYRSRSNAHNNVARVKMNSYHFHGVGVYKWQKAQLSLTTRAMLRQTSVRTERLLFLSSMVVLARTYLHTKSEIWIFIPQKLSRDLIEPCFEFYTRVYVVNKTVQIFVLEFCL